MTDRCPVCGEPTGSDRVYPTDGSAREHIHREHGYMTALEVRRARAHEFYCDVCWSFFSRGSEYSDIVGV